MYAVVAVFLVTVRLLLVVVVVLEAVLEFVAMVVVGFLVLVVGCADVM